MTKAEEERLLGILEKMNEAAIFMSNSLRELTEIAKILDLRISELEKARNAQ